MAPPTRGGTVVDVQEVLSVGQKRRPPVAAVVSFARCCTLGQPYGGFAKSRDAPQAVVGESDSIWSYLVQKYDTDADGRVTREEYTRDDATFARLDHNSDGAVTDG